MKKLPKQESTKSRGSTFLELLAGLAVSGMVIFVLFDLMGNAEKGKRGIQGSVDFDGLLLTLHTITSDRDFCQIAFRNLNNTAAAKHSVGALPAEKLGAIYWANVNHTPLNPLDGVRLVAVGETLSDGVRVTSLDLQSIHSRILATGEAIEVVELVVKAERLSAAGTSLVGSLSNESNPFRFSIQKDGSDGTIQKCLLDSEQATPSTEESLKNILASMVSIENVACFGDAGYVTGDPLKKVEVTCQAGYKLFSCSGGPGDQTETLEAYTIYPNFTTNTCTQISYRGGCGNSGAEPWERQKIIAACYPVAP